MATPHEYRSYPCVAGPLDGKIHRFVGPVLFVALPDEKRTTDILANQIGNCAAEAVSIRKGWYELIDHSRRGAVYMYRGECRA